MAKRRKRTLSKFEKIEIAVSYLLRASLVFVIVWASLHYQWFVLFVSLLTLLTSFLPNVFERTLKIALPIEFELVIILFIYASLFLGEVGKFYQTFWWWDILIHSGASLAVGFVGFLVVYTLLVKGRLRTSPFFLAVFSFAFALGIGALWEIFEFLMDITLGLNMQKSGLVDTMTDLLVDSGAALVAAVIGYIYVLNRGSHSHVFKYLINHYFDENNIHAKK